MMLLLIYKNDRQKPPVVSLWIVSNSVSCLMPKILFGAPSNVHLPVKIKSIKMQIVQSPSICVYIQIPSPNFGHLPKGQTEVI